LEAADKALALKQSSKTWSLKAGLLTSAGRSEEAAAATRQKRIQEIKERLPERDPSATAALVDLGPYYNLVVSEPLHPLAGFSADGAENLSQLKPGVQPLAGVPFDVRGLIHLQGANSQMSVLQRSYERACKGIKVGAKANKLHFLHGLGWVRNDPAGTVVGTFVIHYADGQTGEIPVRLVEDGFDWRLSNWRRNSPSGTDSKLAWRGASGIGQEVELGVYLKTWSNPRPDVEISTLDFISAMNDANPFLLALTLE